MATQTTQALRAGREPAAAYGGKRCPDCERTNPDDGRYCVHCGASLTRPDGELTPAQIILWSKRRGAAYALIFARLFPRGEISLKPSWSWAAALVPFWMIYRRLYLEWLLFIFTEMLLGAADVWISPLVWILQGMLGNALYFLALERRARREAQARAEVAAHQYG
jgi:hypothetical protein